MRIEKFLNSAFGDVPEFGRGQPEKIQRQGYRLAVEIPGGKILEPGSLTAIEWRRVINLDEKQWIIGYAVHLPFDHRTRKADGVRRGPMNLGRTANRV